MRGFMVNRRFILLALACALHAIAPAAPAAATSAVANPFATGVFSTVAGITPPAPTVPPDRTEGLTDAQLAGQRIVYGFSGRTAPPALLQRIRQGRAAGVILFSYNIGTRAQIRRLVASLQRAAEDRDLPEALRAPLLIMVDQEGGQVRRLPGSPTVSPAEIGRDGRTSMAFGAGRAAGQNLAGVGINVNLAPVVDVARSGSVIGRFERSFGSDVAKVSRLGSAFVRGLESAGVQATPKHFPGLGAAKVNTDVAHVTINLPVSTLRRVDETPFANAIRAGADLVMVSSAVYPAFGPRVPAAFSRPIVEGELRERLGFGGVVVTDALGTPGLAGYGTPRQQAERAAGVSVDVLLYSNGYEQGTRGATYLEQALRAGRLDRDEFEQSVNRVIALREAIEAADN
jgi:beta-N-acetylhexosaminidase